MPSKDSWGGPAACEPPFVESLRGLGVDVATEEYVFGDTDRPTPFLSRVSRVLKTAFRFRSLLKKDRYDLLFLNSAFDTKSVLRDAISLFIMSPRPAKVFLKVHGSLAHEFISLNGVWGMLVNYLRSRVDAYGLFTREELQSFIKLGFSPSQFFRVRNAITIGSEIPAGFVRTHKESGSLFDLLFVSRFVPTKGLIATIKACALLNQQGVKLRLTCVGDGEVRAEAEALAHQLGIADLVRFTGYISESEVSKLFLGSDIFVFPTSHPEGFPIVLFKAIATGMPIVTTAVRAAGEYLTEPENCLFCTVEPENIAEKVRTLIDDKTLREGMSASNLKYGSTLLPEIIAEDYLLIFRSVVNGEPSDHRFDQ